MGLGVTPEYRLRVLNDFAAAGLRHRNCSLNLDDLDWDRPDLNCEPQQARGITRNLQLDETRVRVWLSCPVDLCEVQTYLATDLAKSRFSSRVAVWFGGITRVRSSGGNHELPSG